MNAETRHLDQDRPIGHPQHDKLDRGPFVDSLVRALLRSEVDENGKLVGRAATGFVVGLTGKWGLGKSSILKLAETQLGAMDHVIVAYFNPWLFNGRDELMRGFFSCLKTAMGKDATEHGRDLANALDRYWGSIDAAGHGIAAVIDAHGGGGLASGFWSKVSVWGKSAKDAMPKVEKLSPEAERKALEKKIADRKVAVVVLIDELDRVDDDEVKAVAQLVKAAGDIEGLSYLVAYDPDRVTDALGRGEGPERRASGARYLEKIIQLPIPLRPLFREDVDALIAAEFGYHGASVPIAGEANQKEILERILHEVTTPRDIKRLIGAFFVLEVSTRSEIDPIDVLAYAWIMTKAPGLRDALAEQFEQLVTDPGETEMVRRVERRFDKKEPPTPLELLGTVAADHSALLKSLFPVFQTRSQDDADKGMRIFRRRNLIRLLYLGNPPGAIPRAEIERLWRIADPAQLDAELSALRERERLPALLDQLDDLLPQLSPEGDHLFWPALARILTRDTDWMTAKAPEYALVDDAASLLLRAGLRDALQVNRVKAAISALIASGDLALAPWILRKQMYALGLSVHSHSGGGKAIYSKSELQDLMKSETARYRAALLDGSALRRVPNAEAIYVIANQDKWDAELRGALTQQLTGPQALSTMAALILPPGYGSDLKSLKELFDGEAVLRELEKIDIPAEQFEPWIESAVLRLEAMLAGRRTDSPFDDEEAEG